MLIILRLDLKASQIINIRIDRLRIEIRDPIEEMMFQERKESG